MTWKEKRKSIENTEMMLPFGTLITPLQQMGLSIKRQLFFKQKKETVFSDQTRPNYPADNLTFSQTKHSQSHQSKRRKTYTTQNKDTVWTYGCTNSRQKSTKIRSRAHGCRIRTNPNFQKGTVAEWTKDRMREISRQGCQTWTRRQ